MSDNVYGISEVVGSSRESIEDAVSNAIATADKTVRHLEWFEVTQIRGHIVDGACGHYQVMLKLGFRYDR